MSILLDAVTRKKQQDGVNVPDPVMTPRPNYQSNSNLELRVSLGQLKWPVVFTLALGAGVGLAWLASLLNQEKVSLNPKSTVTQVVSTPVVLTKESTSQSVSTTQTSDSSIRIAGKVALPIAKAYVAPAVAPVLTRNVATKVMTVSSNIEAVAQEPIILGANANQRGMNELAKLKREVEYAAFDVGMNTEKDQSSNNLVAAFEAALKDVEAQESKNTEVTADELNPIPQVSTSDGVPKFGELPFSLQKQVPDFNITAHVYSSDPNRRWLNVDGVELQQGDTITGGLKIVEIRPRDIVLEIQGENFKVPAI